MELGEPPGRDDGDCRAKARLRGGRSSATQRAMFNFSGHALADLAVAQVVYETALRKGLGTRLAR
jgi:ornithine cyclodeaminase/alanine dehydrogenase-like protein (mu-crystallin family)